MKLYHGTTEEVARKALREGLKPRIATGRSNWKHTIESNPSMVYLTAAYAPFFAMQSIRDDTFEDKLGLTRPPKDTAKMAIIEIDTTLLERRWLMPDEDFIEQATRGHTEGSLIKGKTMVERTRWIRNNIHKFQEHWQLSVEKLGNCAFKGTISPSAISRVSIVEFASNPEIIWSVDPCITIINYLLVGEKYKAITRWFFKEELTVDEWFRLNHLNPTLSEERLAEARTHWTEVLGKQDGIDIIFSR